MLFRRFAALVLLMAVSPCRADVESWADKRLGVTGGLELWFAPEGLNAVDDKTPTVGRWRDASGLRRDVSQSKPNARPKLLLIGKQKLARFDGVDDHLRAVELNRKLRAITLFLAIAPRDNPGDFRGPVSAKHKDINDYQSGFNVDMSFGASPRLDAINVEGRGFGGARNLLKEPSEFGVLRIVSVIADPTKKTVSLAAGKSPPMTRPFAPGEIVMDEFTVGARSFTNGPGIQEIRGFFPGDIAEVLLYDRVLSDAELSKVRQYLDAKHAELAKELPKDLIAARAALGGETLVLAQDPPEIQMLVPGFTVRKLPLDLPNVNNLRFRPDGKCLAVCYNGDVYLLSDTDGDGLEDKAVLWWDNKGKLISPIGAALTPPGFKPGVGIIVASKGKCSALIDTDGDDKADKEVVLASGWKPLPVNVDAIGVAVDPKDHSIYFGLGTPDFSNGYLKDKNGKAQYKLTGSHGNIQRIKPDLSGFETVCTGVRFSIGMEFNHLGDLFCTDQEGATWMPNGNPFDELLHIQKGKHYGFPPAHPVHLPGVVDEPSVCDYKPQHQSTCGMTFNDAPPGKPIFGPEFWRHDALVTGESRGKIYRTKLVKTAHGYVSQNQIIACLHSLTVDVALAPNGDLAVATHSGPPDWGTGPAGKGTLYRISYTDRDAPQPVATWIDSPSRICVALDKPLDPAVLKDWQKVVKLTRGEYVEAGDRYEPMYPPYAIVNMQKRTTRFDVPVSSLALSPNRRTLEVHATGLGHNTTFALTLPSFERSKNNVVPSVGILHQDPVVDLTIKPTGIEAVFLKHQKSETNIVWRGWLPHFEVLVSRDLTVGSALQQDFLNACGNSDVVMLHGRIEVANMLRPAIQPGAEIDFQRPPERASLQFRSFAFNSFKVVTDNGTALAPVGERKRGELDFEVDTTKSRSLDVNLVLPESSYDIFFSGSYTSSDEVQAQRRALLPQRILVPWVKDRPEAAPSPYSRDPRLNGGDWYRGRQVFFSEAANCAKCHVVRGEGGKIGPDLSMLVQRDYDSVHRDVFEPSKAINPDFAGFVIQTTSGKLLTGCVKTDGDTLIVGNEKGETTKLTKAEVEAMKPAAKSIMPEDLPKAIGPEKMKDLMTFLLTDQPRMPDYGPLKPPAPRTAEQIAAIVAGSEKPSANPKTLRVVLVAGPKDHGPGEHDYPAWQKVWHEWLASEQSLKVSTAWNWPSVEQMKTADVLLFFQHGEFDAKRMAELDAYLKRGGGAIYLHWAVEAGNNWEAFAQRIGLASNSAKIKFRHGPLDMTFASTHPIARNFGKISFYDESYWHMTGDVSKVDVLATGVEDGKPQPLVWAKESNGGRVFVSILGHYNWTFDDPLYRILLLRAIAWTAKEHVDRFNHLVTSHSN